MAPFIPINCAALPENLLESELFGHRKGAFTGAVEAHEGVFARCSPHGAIFLDEIGDVSTPVQIKLLQVVEDRTFSPVGSHERRRFRGRVITATHKPLHELRERGLFRDDFYYRLCSDAITVPPLRQRLREEPREMDELLAHLLARLVGEAEPALLSLVRVAIRESVGDEYAWPGNVRELEQAVRRILLMRRYVPDEKSPVTDPERSLAEAVVAGTLDADALLARYCANIHARTRNIEETARRTNLDRRTVKRYLAMTGAARREPGGKHSP
jgi:transcriptional regulator with PAS, ATPase and Fis domain